MLNVLRRILGMRWGWRIACLCLAGLSFGCGTTCPPGTTLIGNACEAPDDSHEQQRADPTEIAGSSAAGAGGMTADDPVTKRVTPKSNAGNDSVPGCVQGDREVCDGVDNDCDAAIDEDLDPQPEVCDATGVDENCDGVSNEGCDCTPGDTRACGVTRGACQQGQNTCSAGGKWQNQCAGEVQAQTEICDGQHDEDCDGQSDELDPDCECVDGAVDRMCSAGMGVCAAGMRECSAGKWGDCSPQLPKQARDICGDDLDNDCNGMTDEAAAVCDKPGLRCLEGRCVPDGDIEAAIETAGGYVLTTVEGGGFGTPTSGPQTAIHTDAATDSGPWEQFEIVWQDAAFTKFALKTADGLHYVTAVNGGGIGGPNDATCPIHTDAQSVGPWEMVTLHIKGSRVSIETANGSYLTAQDGGGVGGPNTMPIHTDATRILGDEVFVLRR